MDQKEHIATLCALGTIGAAVAGLTFAIDHPESDALRPGKRKWPGANGQTKPMLPLPPTLPRRSVSQPTTPLLTSDTSTFSFRSNPVKRLSSAPRPSSITKEDFIYYEPPSRDSSKSRQSILRPRTAASRNTADKRGSSTSSSWLKRLSSFSSHSTSPAPSIRFHEQDETSLPATIPQRPLTSATTVPNKLVKRSISQRGLSADEAQGQILRRPATSHQRSQTFREILARPSSHDTNDSTTNPLPHPALTDQKSTRSWRPYFETAFPRKRRRSESATDSSQIRVISLPVNTEPFILRGSDLTDSPASEAPYERPTPDWNAAGALPTTSRRSRRSLNSLRRSTRRRNFTDPAVQLSRVSATGTISPVQARGNISIPSDMMTGTGLIRIGSPQFTSSPPMSNSDNETSFRLRGSISASDPPTTSSDVDGQVFSDQESVDCRSDTVYDSIATRNTNTSGPAVKETRLETIFAARTSDEADSHPDIWQNLAHADTQENHVMSDSPFECDDSKLHGMGIAISHDKSISHTSACTDVLLATPPRSASLHTEDFSVTPVPMKTARTHIDSSPPFLPVTSHAKNYDQVSDMLEDMKLDDEDEEIDWSANGDPLLQHSDLSETKALNSSPPVPTAHFIARFQEADTPNLHTDGVMQRPSIFDWSDQQLSNGASRPKTVHGKQGNTDRSRPSGRRGAPQLHFRSQSVPINRDNPQEELPTMSKYKTWRLGAQPVSEEWSDDFEFDDVDEVMTALPVVDENTNFKDSVRSVRIPQAIIDRQPSVHLQFGQVQEFMALVEELKRLRVSGASLQILNGSAKHLWEDADSIINLATINDEEDAPLASSPASSDPFADLGPLPINVAGNYVSSTNGRRLTTSGRRSVSAVTTPPVHGRARGESLAHARHFLQVMHQSRGTDSSPREIEIHHQKKLPFDTQDLKDLVVRSGVITRALKEEVRRAEGVAVSPLKTPQNKRDEKREDPFSESFWKPEIRDPSPSPTFRTKPGLPKSRSAQSYLESTTSRQDLGPFSSPLSLATVV